MEVLTDKSRDKKYIALFLNIEFKIKLIDKDILYKFLHIHIIYEEWKIVNL